MGIDILRDKRFLVTGSTGCLGCQMVNRLEEMGADVLALILPGYPDEPKRLRWISNNPPIKINSASDLKKIPPVDYAINFHWKTDRSLKFSEQLKYEIDENLHRPGFLWEWLKDNLREKFVNISSTKVFSYLNNSIISDDTEPKPAEPYGIAKLCSEKYFDAYFINSSFSKLHLRLCSVISPGEHPSHLLTQLYNSAFGGKQIVININHPGFFLYSDEMIDYIISATISSTCGRMNLVKNQYSNMELASRFSKLTGRELNAVYEDLSPGAADPVFMTSISGLDQSWIRVNSQNTMIRKMVEFNNLLTA